MARREVREGHLERAADPGVHVMDLAGEAVRRKPLGHSVSVKEGAIDTFRSGPDYAMQSNGVCRHDYFELQRH